MNTQFRGGGGPLTVQRQERSKRLQITGAFLPVVVDDRLQQRPAQNRREFGFDGEQRCRQRHCQWDLVYLGDCRSRLTISKLSCVDQAANQIVAASENAGTDPQRQSLLVAELEQVRQKLQLVLESGDLV